MPIDNVLLFQKIHNRAKDELLPKLRVGPKSRFCIHTLINFVLNIVYPKKRKDSYLERYNTTLGYTIAMATRYGVNVARFGNWRTLCHEVMHALRAKKWTRFLFGYLYLWPLSQGILFALTCWLPVFWSSGWVMWVTMAAWLVIAGLHFIPQLPDPWRKHWEFEAYSISMHLYNLVHGRVDGQYIAALVENFHSMMYYIMEPNREKITKQLETLAVKVTAGDSPVKDYPIVKIAEEEYARMKEAA
jgi:hypothetical protein